MLSADAKVSVEPEHFISDKPALHMYPVDCMLKGEGLSAD